MALTIRLSIDETAELEKLREFYELKTASGTIKILIHFHKELLNKLRKAKTTEKKLAKELETITNLINNQKIAEQQVRTEKGRISKWINKKIPY